MSILGPNNDFRGPMSQIAASDPGTMTRDAAKTIGFQENLNRYADGLADQFVSAQSSLVEKARQGKFDSMKRIVDGRVFKHFFTVFETGFALSQQWADMES